MLILKLKLGFMENLILREIDNIFDKDSIWFTVVT